VGAVYLLSYYSFICDSFNVGVNNSVNVANITLRGRVISDEL
jgi:hypothetical protein